MNDDTLLLLIPVIVIQLGLLLLALRDLIRPERTVKGGSKLLWAVVIIFIGIIGPIVYFVVGRDDQ